MKIFEVPKISRGEEVPGRIDMEGETLDILIKLKQTYNIRIGAEDTAEPPTDFYIKLWESLMYQAIYAVVERVYNAVNKNTWEEDRKELKNLQVAEKDGVKIWKRKGEIRKRINGVFGKHDGLQKVPKEKVKERFDFLLKKVFSGFGFGNNMSLTTLVDAIQQDLNLDDEDSLIKNELKTQDKETRRYPNIHTFLYRLIEQHRTKISVESILTKESCLQLPPIFIKTKSGKPKIYKVDSKDGENEKLVVFQMDRSEDLEVETYLQGLCIGDDEQEYKKALVEGKMIFFSVGGILKKPITFKNAQTELERDNSYLEDALENRLELADFEVQRIPDITISAYVNGKDVTFDQFKLFEDITLDEVRDKKFVEMFLLKILPDICKELERQGYLIKSFGDDLKYLSKECGNEDVYVLGKGLTNVKKIKEGDKIIGNKVVFVPPDISIEQLRLLCNFGMPLRITSILDNKTLIDSIERANCRLIASPRSEDKICLPNLKYAKQINFRGFGVISLPSLVEMEDEFNTDDLKGLTELYAPKLKKLKRLTITDANISLSNLESCDQMMFINNRKDGKPMFIDLSNFDFNNLREREGFGVGFDKNIFFLVSDPENARSVINSVQTNSIMGLQLSPENFFRSKGEYLVKTGKYWGE